jgi:UDP-N-acetylglucosamine--N-acetylmuramyl-(pentapeptide) pyrophosphoryl-undecaprenol N-acetylglucosamine transferase
MKELKRVIISGGGTGGHIFPAIAIANEIKSQFPDAEILFVGAEGKMEMEKVPAAGYKIIGLPIVGLQRKLTLANLMLPFKLVNSLLKARKVIRDFKPQVVIGVGGYASGPTLQMANTLKIPTVVQEQNSYPGKTNKILAKKAAKICVAYEQMERFFPNDKIAFTGNPVRSEVADIAGKREDALAFFGLSSEKKTVLVIGGSLGALTLNDALDQGIHRLAASDIQVIWQCGKYYADGLLKKWEGKLPNGVWLNPFIMEMDKAYAAADIVVSRAGALSVSELCLVNKPTILVPSPNVAEDHQTKNAMALVNNDAAILIKDSEAREDLIERVISLAKDENQQRKLSEAIAKMGKPNATKDIVSEILNVI